MSDQLTTERLRELAAGATLHGHERNAMAAELLAKREECASLWATGKALLDSSRNLLAERDAARAEAKKYHDALVARHGGEPVALLSEMDEARADLQAMTVEAMRAGRELAAVKRQRDEAIAGVVIAAGQAWDDCTDNGVYRKEDFLKYLGWAIAASQPAQQPKPIEPRPWWVVFGLERHAASRMVASAPDSGPLIVDMGLQHLADDANKRGVHPTEIARALDEARADWQPKPEVQP